MSETDTNLVIKAETEVQRMLQVFARGGCNGNEDVSTNEFTCLIREAVRPLVRQRTQAIQELRNIALAKPHTWEDCAPGDFQDWAQSRARHTLRELGEEV